VAVQEMEDVFLDEYGISFSNGDQILAAIVVDKTLQKVIRQYERNNSTIFGRVFVSHTPKQQIVECTLVEVNPRNKVYPLIWVIGLAAHSTSYDASVVDGISRLDRRISSIESYLGRLGSSR
jgi:hypothetical protein